MPDRSATISNNTRRSLRFIGEFVIIVTGLYLLAQHFSRAAQQYVWVVAESAAAVLYLIGLPLRLIVDDATGIYIVRLAAETYEISLDCTGFYTVLLYGGAVLAYPASVTRKLMGLASGLPAFLSFSVLRVVLLNLIAYLEPDLVDVFHIFIMSIANLGFALFVWIAWLQYTQPYRPTG